MQCPICNKHTMLETELLPELSGMACTACTGVWIKRATYEAWLAKQPGDLPETDQVTELRDTEPRKARICPQCQHLLLPYRVEHGIPFSIDDSETK